MNESTYIDLPELVLWRMETGRAGLCVSTQGKAEQVGRRKRGAKQGVSYIIFLPCYLGLSSWKRKGLQAKAEEADFKSARCGAIRALLWSQLSCGGCKEAYFPPWKTCREGQIILIPPRKNKRRVGKPHRDALSRIQKLNTLI